MKITARSRNVLFAIALSLAPFAVSHGAEAIPASAHVNINTADAGALSTLLNGVGERKAEAIIAYRKKNGPFQTVTELTKVEGIGESILAKNADSIVVK